MKKNILIALFALLAVVLNGNAQNNTYNMVIEMANGTKITIGPNDVKNISFNNGELVMTGEDINSLVEQQNKTDKRIDSLAAEEAKSQKDIEQIKPALATCQAEIYDIETLINNIPLPDLSNYATKDELQAIIQLINAIPTCQCDMSSMNARLQNLEAIIATLLTEIENLKQQGQ